jgi:hypothetical protein
LTKVPLWSKASCVFHPAGPPIETARARSGRTPKRRGAREDAPPVGDERSPVFGKVKGAPKSALLLNFHGGGLPPLKQQIGAVHAFGALDEAAISICNAIYQFEACSRCDIDQTPL